jgi:hypothetical protein
MPWETEGDGVRFSGHLTDLMSAIVTAYKEESDASRVVCSTGAYVTATAIVIREILLEQLADEPQAAEFLVRVGDALDEDDEGTVTIRTFDLLDDVAGHIEGQAWQAWLADPAARAAIAEIAEGAVAE